MVGPDGVVASIGPSPARRGRGIETTGGDAGHPGLVVVAVGLLVGPEVLDEVDLEESSGTVRALAEATLRWSCSATLPRIHLDAPRDVGVPCCSWIGLPRNRARSRRGAPCSTS